MSKRHRTPAVAEAPESRGIGTPAPVGSLGWLLGIPLEPETPAEHDARLGAAAGTFQDAGWLTGTIAAPPPPITEPEPAKVPAAPSDDPAPAEPAPAD